MPSLDETFHQLRHLLSQPNALNPARSDPFFYFVHDPAETFLAKRKLGVWSAELRLGGWTVETISLAEVLWKIVDDSGLWDELLQLEKGADQLEISGSIREILRSSNAMVESLAPLVAQPRPKAIVFLTQARIASSLHAFPLDRKQPPRPR